MSAESILTEEQLVERATDILVDRLGLAEAVRFLALSARGRVESVARHRAWQDTLQKDAFFDEVFSGSEGTPSGSVPQAAP